MYRYEYDRNNNLTKLTCQAAGGSWNTVYTYDKDNRTVTTTFASGKVLTVTYDAIGRVTKRRLGLTSNYDTDLTYVPGYDGSQTALLSTYKNGSDDAYEYAYDDNGNITSIARGTVSVTYEYNGANELTRENNQFTNQTATYEYDSWGNITKKKIYAYTTATDPGTPISTISYGYSTGDWKDQLVSYDGQPISYDAMGNPTTYRGKALTWRGKQLTGIAAGTDTIAYSYDENGLRLQKTVNNVATDYYYNGSVLIGLVKGSDTLRFSYDAAGLVQAVNHNGTYYYYLRNGQGDIVKLIDGSGNIVVKYTYDSWGKPLSCTGTLAITLGVLNPFRYRGYVYDEETQWYYLKSRYYDPEACRFISADVYLSTGQGVLGHNCYAYCLNNPVNGIDSCGLQMVPVDIEEGSSKGSSALYFEKGEELQAIEALEQGNDVYYQSVHIVLLSKNGPFDASFTVLQTIFWYPINRDIENTLRHEYGHAVQEKSMGEIRYFEYIVIPSLAYHVMSSADDPHYYNMPWERGAEHYGDVQRDHSKLSNFLWKAYDSLAHFMVFPVWEG